MINNKISDGTLKEFLSLCFDDDVNVKKSVGECVENYNKTGISGIIFRIKQLFCSFFTSGSEWQRTTKALSNRLVKLHMPYDSSDRQRIEEQSNNIAKRILSILTYGVQNQGEALVDMALESSDKNIFSDKWFDRNVYVDLSQRKWVLGKDMNKTYD